MNSAPFDAVYVQFCEPLDKEYKIYTNVRLFKTIITASALHPLRVLNLKVPPCKSNPDSQEFNFETWDNWAKHTSPNPNVKVYIGAPGSKPSAGEGYVDAAALAKIVQSVQAKYANTLGGVMIWDIDSAFCMSPEIC